MSDEPRANPGFAAAELARALHTGASHADAETRLRAEARSRSWLQVLEGMASGLLNIGSRKPVAGYPEWVTPEVLRGGFASGRALAGGELLPHELELARRLRLPPQRGALNHYFVSAPGLEELLTMLASGCYRVRVPEEAALLAVAWLSQQGQVESARNVLEEITPFFETLRFYPVPAGGPARRGVVVVQSVARTRQQLDHLRDRPRWLQMREVLLNWAPLQDRVVSLFLETVEEGWPCQHYPDGWAQRAALVLRDCQELVDGGALWQPRGDSLRLLRTLAAALKSPATLSGRQVGMVRHILACISKKRGLPGCPRHTALRQQQSLQAARPGLTELCRALVARLADYPQDEGLETLEPVILDLALPPRLLAPLSRCLEGSVEELLDRGSLRSSEMLAKLVPLATSAVHSAGFADEQSGRLFESVYVAFRRRRSLLLLDLQHQVRLHELPWVRPLLPHRQESAGQAEARRTLGGLVSTVLGRWPHCLIPNKLVQELDALARLGDLKLPLVEEVAADIFMGSFSEKFLRAAQQAAALLQGSLYQRYYGLDFDEVAGLEDLIPVYGTPASPGFARICQRAAGVSPGRSRSVVNNGKTIEQAQILTTHNLAVLYRALPLDLNPVLLARICLTRVASAQRRVPADWRGRLKQRARCAHAWRQMIFFLSLLPLEQQQEFLEWASQQTRHPRLGDTVQKWLHGLSEALADRPHQVFLGWVSKADPK